MSRVFARRSRSTFSRPVSPNSRSTKHTFAFSKTISERTTILKTNAYFKTLLHFPHNHFSRTDADPVGTIDTKGLEAFAAETITSVSAAGTVPRIFRVLCGMNS